MDETLDDSGNTAVVSVSSEERSKECKWSPTPSNDLPFPLSSPPSTAQLLRVELAKYPEATFNVVHINAQSLLRHFAEFENIFESQTDVHLILVSETWAKPSLPDSLYHLQGFKFFRNDRINKGGGGVGIYSKQEIQLRILATSENEYSCSTEFIIAEASIGNQKLLISCVYRPPETKFTNFENAISQFLPLYEHVIILGDMNYDLLSSKPAVQYFRNVIDSFNLTASSLQPTFHTETSESLLDLILTRNSEKILNYGQFPVPGICHHDLIFASYSLKVPKVRAKVISYRDFSRLNHDAILQDAAQIPWDLMYSFPDINDRLNFFNRSIVHLLDTHVPLRKKRVTRPASPWLTAEIKNLMRQRDCIYKKYRNLSKINVHDAEEFLQQYRTLRNRCTHLVRKAKLNFARGILQSTSNSKMLWNKLNLLGIKGKKRNENDIGNIFSPDELNEYFCTTNLSDDNDTFSTSESPVTPTNNEREFNFRCVTPREVESAILNIKSKATGVDQIPLQFIKTILPSILLPITNIFNLSIMSSTFPSSWKIAKVIALPKTKQILSADDLRPISILPALSKALEHIISNQIRTHISKFGLLNPFQSGFRKHHSTLTTLVHISDDIRSALDAKELTLLTLLDFSKAFQSIVHEALYSKLRNNFYFSTHAVKWVKNYIEGRRQFVTLSDKVSNLRNLPRGVPQGSVLGPLLFSMYINDLPTTLMSCKHHLYADDFQIYISCKPEDLDTTVGKLNDDLKNISAWTQLNGLRINPTKSQCIMFSSKRSNKLSGVSIPDVKINESVIPLSHTVKNLGVTMDQHLEWGPHINSVCRKASYSLHSLVRLKHFLPTALKVTLVKTLVFPHFDYCDVILSNLTCDLQNRLQRIQNACVRFIYNLKYSDHLTPYYNKLSLLKLSDRRLLHTAALVYKTIHLKQPSYLSSRFETLNARHNHNTRSGNLRTFSIPQYHSNFFSDSFTISSIRLWNNLPSSVRESGTLSSFKKIHERKFNFQVEVISCL